MTDLPRFHVWLASYLDDSAPSVWTTVQAESEQEAAEVVAERKFAGRDYPGEIEFKVLGEGDDVSAATTWHVEVVTIPTFWAFRKGASL